MSTTKEPSNQFDAKEVVKDYFFQFNQTFHYTVVTGVFERHQRIPDNTQLLRMEIITLWLNYSFTYLDSTKKVNLCLPLTSNEVDRSLTQLAGLVNTI